jgi:hypothetical protein
MPGVGELYVLARRVLLDALDALGDHRNAVILVGAQAIYLRVGEADLAVAPFTSDGDLAIDPAVLGEVPPLEHALTAAGFFPKANDSVGVWITHRQTTASPNTPVQIDLLVPASVSPGTGRRAARLVGHDVRSARIVKGLDGAVVDAEVMRVVSLDDGDARAHEIRVAGPAALLVAKVHKISERQGTARQSDKDALDVLRILRGTATEEIGERYRRLLGDGRSNEAASAGIELLRDQFGRRAGVGIEMAIRSAGPLANADELATSCELLANDLLDLLRKA